MKLLTLIRGLPGSGKSTLAAKLARADSAIHIEADQFFVTHYGSYEFDKSKLKEAHKWCQEQTEKAMQCGSPVIVSNTFTQTWELQPYLELAGQYKYKLQVIHVQGEWSSIHECPQDVIDNMEKRWEPYWLGDIVL